jgi:hypothetical protein
MRDYVKPPHFEFIKEHTVKKLLMTTAMIVLATSAFAKEKKPPAPKTDFSETELVGTCTTFETDGHKTDCGTKFSILTDGNDANFHGFITHYGFNDKDNKPHSVKVYFFSVKAGFQQSDGGIDFIVNSVALAKDDEKPHQLDATGKCNMNSAEDKDETKLYLECTTKATFPNKDEMNFHWMTTAEHLQPVNKDNAEAQKESNEAEDFALKVLKKKGLID